MSNQKLIYNGKAITEQEQIALLSDRGVLIHDPDKAKKYLSSIGFYRFFSYAKPFLQSQKLSFESVLDLYTFDRKLRLLMLDAVEQIEVAFRVAISERMSIQYDPFWYHNSNHFIDIKRHSDFLEEVTKLINRRKHPLIKHYCKSYFSPDFPPSWMLIECLTFGNWSKIFHNLKNRKDKKLIAQRFDQSFKVLGSWIISLIEVRNICAHHERLWNHVFHYPPKGAPQDVCQLEKFYQQAYIVNRLLQSINADSKWKLKLKNLFQEHSTIPFQQMGFLDDWQNDAFWVMTRG